MAVKRNLQNVKESSIEAYLVKRVQALGGLAQKVQVLGYRGMVDRLVILPGGRIFFVELKRPKGGKMSAQQSALHCLYKKLGVQVVIISNQEQIDQLLNA